MTFKKGDPRPPGAGRRLGQKARKTIVGEVVSRLLNGQDVSEEIFNLAKDNPKTKLSVLIELLPYIHPKLQSTQIEGKIETEDSETVKELLADIEKLERDKEEMELHKRSGAV